MSEGQYQNKHPTYGGTSYDQNAYFGPNNGPGGWRRGGDPKKSQKTFSPDKHPSGANGGKNTRKTTKKKQEYYDPVAQYSSVMTGDHGDKYLEFFHAICDKFQIEKPTKDRIMTSEGAISWLFQHSDQEKKLDVKHVATNCGYSGANHALLNAIVQAAYNIQMLAAVFLCVCIMDHVPTVDAERMINTMFDCVRDMNELNPQDMKKCIRLKSSAFRADNSKMCRAIRERNHLPYIEWFDNKGTKIYEEIASVILAVPKGSDLYELGNAPNLQVIKKKESKTKSELGSVFSEPEPPRREFTSRYNR